MLLFFEMRLMLTKLKVFAILFVFGILILTLGDAMGAWPQFKNSMTFAEQLVTLNAFVLSKEMAPLVRQNEGYSSESVDEGELSAFLSSWKSEFKKTYKKSVLWNPVTGVYVEEALLRESHPLIALRGSDLKTFKALYRYEYKREKALQEIEFKGTGEVRVFPQSDKNDKKQLKLEAVHRLLHYFDNLRVQALNQRGSEGELSEGANRKLLLSWTEGKTQKMIDVGGGVVFERCVGALRFAISEIHPEILNSELFPDL